jgi:multiple sugar transport system permease protein
MSTDALVTEAEPTTRRPHRKRSVHRQTGVGLLFVAPFSVLLVVFLLLPLAYAFKLSLYRSTLIGGDVFSGLGNYQDVWADPEFRQGVFRVLKFSLIQTPVMIGVALVAALMIDSLTSRFTTVFRLAMFAPYAVPVAIGSLMWGYLYSPDLGPLHTDMLRTDALALFSMGNIVTWQWAGYNMIILYAALQGLPREVLEAARVDGAGHLRTAFSVKTPMISSALVLTVIFTIIGSLQFFIEPLLLQPLNPGTITNSYTPNIYALYQAFTYQQYNYSAAVSFALGAVVFVGSYLFLFFTRKRSGLQ